MSDLLSVENLNIRFRQDGAQVHAVRGIGFTVKAGEVVALVGESGSGKSVTALSTVALLGAWHARDDAIGWSTAGHDGAREGASITASASAAALARIGEDDEHMDAALCTAGGATAQRQRHASVAKLRQAGRRFKLGAAHVRHSVTAKRISVQLVNVS